MPITMRSSLRHCVALLSISAICVSASNSFAGPTVVDQRRYVAVHTGGAVNKVRVTDQGLGSFDRTVSAANQTGGFVGAGTLRQISNVNASGITFAVTGDASQAVGGAANRYVQINSFIDVVLNLDTAYRFQITPWTGFSPNASVGSPVQGISGQWSISTARYQNRFDRGSEAGIIRADRAPGSDTLTLSQDARSIPASGEIGPGQVRFQAEVVGRAMADSSSALLNFNLGSSLVLRPVSSNGGNGNGSGSGGGTEVIPLPPAVLAAIVPMIAAVYMTKKRRRSA